MKTYTCPICGKNYTSAIAMANCVAECAKNEDKNKALEEAENEMLLAKENLEQAVENYNALSTECEYTIIISKKLKNAESSEKIIKASNKFSTDPKSLNDWLNSILNIDTPSKEESDLDKEFEKELTALEKRLINNNAISNENRNTVSEDIKEMRRLFYKGSEKDKKDCLDFMKMTVPIIWRRK